MCELYLTVDFASEYVVFRGIIFDNTFDSKYDGFGIAAQKSIHKTEEYYGQSRIIYHSPMTYIENRVLRRISKEFNRLDTKYQNLFAEQEFGSGITNAIHCLMKATKCKEVFAYSKDGKKKKLSFDEICGCDEDWNLLSTLIREGN